MTMSVIFLRIVAVLACVLAFGGCGRDGVDLLGYPSDWPLEMPAPPEPVNAQLAANIRRCGDTRGEGDTVIVGRVVSSKEYARTPKGDWARDWAVNRVEMIALEKGHWDRRIDPDSPDGLGPVGLSFITYEARPTNPRIYVDGSPWPYQPGLVFAFTLDTRVTPAMIVGRQFRGEATASGYAMTLRAWERLYDTSFAIFPFEMKRDWALRGLLDAHWAICHGGVSFLFDRLTMRDRDIESVQERYRFFGFSEIADRLGEAWSLREQHEAGEKLSGDDKPPLYGGYTKQEFEDLLMERYNRHLNENP